MEPDEERRKTERTRVLREIERTCWESITKSVCGIFCFIFIVVLFLISLASTIALSIYYHESSDELKTLKSEEKGYLQAPDITKKEKDTKNWNLNRLAKKIEDEEYSEYEYFVFYMICLSLTIAIPTTALLFCIAHGVSEYLEHIDNTEHCWEVCLFLRYLSAYFTTSRFENLVNRTASDSRVTYNRAEPENVVFQRTHNIEEGVVQETSANLPGVPSTSNN